MDIELERKEFAAHFRTEHPGFRHLSDHEITDRRVPAQFLGWCRAMRVMAERFNNPPIGE
jgi:hypothetical protein